MRPVWTGHKITRWAPANPPGWEGLVEVSRHGDVRRLPRRVKCGRGFKYEKGGLCTPTPWNTGYLVVQLRSQGRQTGIGVHRLVLYAFVGPPPTSDCEGNHKDGNKHNNHISNLEWITPKGNSQHAVKTGLRIYHPPDVGARRKMRVAQIKRREREKGWVK